VALSTRNLVYLRVHGVVGMHVEELTGMFLWLACYISDSQLVAWAEDDAVQGNVFDTAPVPDPDHPSLNKFLKVSRQVLEDGWRLRVRQTNLTVHNGVQDNVTRTVDSEMLEVMDSFVRSVMRTEGAKAERLVMFRVSPNVPWTLDSESRFVYHLVVGILQEPSPDPDHPNLGKFLRAAG